MNGFDPYSSGARAVALALRTTHLGGMAVVVGGLQLGVPAATLRSWIVLTAVSGAGLLVSEMSHSRHWAYQGRGLAATAHVAALALLAVGWGSAATWLALVLGAVGSHLPKKLRKWSFRHRAVVE
jgi:hypothetical protein